MKKKKKKLNQRETGKPKVAGKVTKKEELIYDIKMNLLLINCRSVKTKLTSLVENIKTNNTTQC